MTSISASQLAPGSGLRTPGLARSLKSGVWSLFSNVRYQRQLAGPLDGRLQLALVRGAGARNPARQNLAPLRHEGPQQLHVLVVDVVDFVGAELTDLSAPEQRAPLAVLFIAGRAAAPAAAFR